MSELAYLDNAATSFPKPDEVHESMGGFYRRCGISPGRTGCDLAIEAEEKVSGTRRKLSALFNQSLLDSGGHKDPNRLVFAPNATFGLNLVLKGTVGPGDHVVTTVTEHNSVIRPLNHLARAGAEATFVEPEPDGAIDPERLRQEIKQNTVLVVVNHASNVTGVVQDLDAIGRACHEAGVPLAVDAAQTAGVVPIDMHRSQIDFLIFTGHKGLMGPTGMGGVCVADRAEITGTLWGGTGVRSAEPFHLEEFPYRLEAGTMNLLGIAGLSAGVDWVTAQGLGAIHDREIELLDLLQQGLAEIDGVTIHGTRSLERRVAVCSITVEGYDPKHVGAFLDVDHDVITRTGLQCAPRIHEHLGTFPRGTVRFSIGPFNTEEHIEMAVRGVAAVAASRGSS